VLNNVYAIHMDEKRHPDPRRFEPLRYKDDFLNLSDSATNPDVTKRDQFIFGAGKFSSPSAYFCLADKPRPPHLPRHARRGTQSLSGHVSHALGL
jgi:hypothetical protein